jgi:hypothetical protein
MALSAERVRWGRGVVEVYWFGGLGFRVGGRTSLRGVAAAFLMMLLGEGLEGLMAAGAGVDALAGVLPFFDFFSPVATVNKTSDNTCTTASVRRQHVSTWSGCRYGGGGRGRRGSFLRRLCGRYRGGSQR